MDLRQWVGWCTERRVALFGARRAEIEGFGRQLEASGRVRATVARRLCTIACFYRYAEEEGLIPISPAVHVRRPRLDYESHATGLDRNEVGGVLVAAGSNRRPPACKYVQNGSGRTPANDHGRSDAASGQRRTASNVCDRAKSARWNRAHARLGGTQRGTSPPS